MSLLHFETQHSIAAPFERQIYWIIIIFSYLNDAYLFRYLKKINFKIFYETARIAQ